MKFRVASWFKLLFILSLAASLFLGQVSVTKAESPNPDQLVQQGVTEYQNRAYQKAIAFWSQALDSYQTTIDNPNTIVVLENLARAYQKVGQSQRALAFWSQVRNRYQQLGNKQQLGRSLTEQAQAYSRLGQHRQAIALLCNELPDHFTVSPSPGDRECRAGSAIALAKSEGDKLGATAALGSLGEAYRLRGNYQLAAKYAQQSLSTAQLQDNFQLTMSALNSLGNIYSSLAQVSYRRAESAQRRGETYGKNSLFARKTESARESDRQALDYFEQNLTLARAKQDDVALIRNLISTLPIYYRLQENDRANIAKQEATNLINSLPPQQTTIYAAIDLANLLQPKKLTYTSCLAPANLIQSRELLEYAVVSAEELQNDRASSFALGELGHTYECEGNYPQALNYTQKARLAAERDKDSLYLWEWQTGRILSNQGNKEKSIAAYEAAITTLESIRDDLLTANRDIQFDFRDTVEPIYRELIDQRLGKETNSLVINANRSDRGQNIASILNTVDSLRLAELQNYFGNECAIADVVSTTRIDPLQPNQETAYFSSILLAERVAIIANFPDGQTKVVWHDKQNKQSITDEINNFRRSLEAFFDDFDTSEAESIYSWLIKPFESDLERANISTLVFIQDGLLRSIPMSALYDGKQFLVEKYALATTPSLNLINRSQLNQSRLRALALGLTKKSSIDGRVFNPLPNVEREVKQVKNTFTDSISLLDNNFTRDRLEQELDRTSYPIVHIATHGQFSAEPEDTFLITGDGEKLTITELDRLIRTTAKDNEPVNLISLTACQTAVGDERAALGLAGVAIQAGASSALASLWNVDDTLTPEVVRKFYSGLKTPNISKAQALQQAQKSFIAQGEHPAYWSPFIIIGDWL
ncbi:MAG: CHAT domain-containing protein [Pleurocapsa sp. MO_192.B19]|nr:CHAT domain-containing protein [Pleurocapsa sp. MO_192.B19]